MGGDIVKKILNEIIEMKKREMEREKENKELREKVAKIVGLNKK